MFADTSFGKAGCVCMGGVGVWGEGGCTPAEIAWMCAPGAERKGADSVRDESGEEIKGLDLI